MREDAHGTQEGPDRAGVPGPILGLVLAGGLSSRMGREKSLLPLGGRTLLDRVLDRLTPQAAAVALNANGDPTRFAAWEVPVLRDDDGGGAGPLAGLAAGLRHAAAGGFGGVLTVPSDAPFLPRDLGARLRAGLGSAGVAVAETPAGLEPLFALWRIEALPVVTTALAEGRLAVRAVMAQAGLAAVAWPDAAPFANLNTADDMAAAEAWLAAAPDRLS